MVLKKKDAMPTYVFGDLYRYHVDKGDWKLVSSPNSPLLSVHVLVIEWLKIRNRRLQVRFGIESQRFKVRSEASECGKQKWRRHQVRRLFSSSPSVFGMTTSLVNLKGVLAM
ncbi:unnamed protein product [Lactuca virosa]|uniref:Uncharacterized protein n=1 Tax=Lactuca virosa TaxID=75947 RepID=A0AAU9MXQ4_9ASTR|nr:unnamed protein product [Lactuca virosa]